MRPSDPTLRQFLAPARGPLAGVLTSGVVASILVIVQAWVVTGLIVAVVHGDGVVSWGWAVVAVIFTPLVLMYQGWTYWVFRKRIAVEHIPNPNVPAAAR